MSITTGQPKITLAGKVIQEKEIEDFEVRSDLDLPDMAEITLSNVGAQFSASLKMGGDVEISFMLEGEEEDKLFKGKITAINPIFDIKRAVSVKILAMNDMHKMAKERRTRTYEKQTVQQVVQKIAGENGLSANFGKEPPTIKYDHLHQHNVTDLAYLRWLAARHEREILVEDRTLYFRKREKDKGPVAIVEFTQVGKGGSGGSGGGGVDYLSLVASSGHQVNKVEVYGWDPKKKEKIVGVANASASSLGSALGTDGAPPLKFYDIPVRSKEEADTVARSILEERMMSYVQGHATTRGNGKIKAGEMVEVKCEDARFNGKYQVISVKHSYSHSGGGMGVGGSGMGGYRTHFKVRRDALGSGGGAAAPPAPPLAR